MDLAGNFLRMSLEKAASILVHGLTETQRLEVMTDVQSSDLGP